MEVAACVQEDKHLTSAVSVKQYGLAQVRQSRELTSIVSSSFGTKCESNPILLQLLRSFIRLPLLDLADLEHNVS
jgi:hypothetical protein